MSRREGSNALSPDPLIRAYAAGIFPMAESRDTEEVYWVDPRMRGILPLDTFHIPAKLKKKVRRHVFEIRCDSAFAAVIECCGEAAANREDTWINKPILDAVIQLHEMGLAHSVEAWQDGRLVGGLYGVSLGAAFFGESMFSRATDASKVALVHLVARLRLGGYRLLDTQFVTDHLKQFGAIEIPATDYHTLLEDALKYQGLFPASAGDDEIAAALEGLFETDPA